MIIINDKVGQLGNRLHEFAFLIANAIENNYTLVNPNFEEYAANFEGTKNDINHFGIKIITFGKHKSIGVFFEKFSNKILFWLGKIGYESTIFFQQITISNTENGSFQLCQPFFTVKVKTKLVFLKGYWYVDFQNIEKHKATIKQIFTPTITWANNVNKCLLNAKKPNSLLIGIHIRRGDYETFLDGKYFFENEVYFQKMKEIEESFLKEKQKVNFLLFSNEPIDLLDFEGLDVKKSENHFMVDLYALAACDYIFGPLSTFTAWASFYGETPICFLHDKNQKVTKAVFNLAPLCG